jgi:HlyD family secretion protein
MKMKILKAALVILTIGVIVFLSVSCTGGASATPTTQTSVASVQRGNISINVTGTGNLALSHTENLAFQVAGTVESIAVEVSDSVKQGQDLAKLDTSTWDKQVKNLQKALETANRAVETANRTLIARQSALTKAQRAVTDAQIAVTAAQLNLQSSQNSLDNIADVKTAQTAVDNAQYALDMAKSNMQAANATGDVTGASYYKTLIPDLTNALNQATKDRNAVLNGTKAASSKTIALQISQAQLDLQQKQRAIETAQLAVDDANNAANNAQSDVNNAKQDVTDAQLNVTDAQSDLDEAKALSPVIVAPFDGIITKISVSGGDEIQKGTVAMIIADPNQFESNFMVTETDVFSIKVGEVTNVSVDALSGLTFPAKITAIAPTATSSQGVVNYKVTAELTSLKPVVPVRATTGTLQRPSSTGGTPPTALPSGGIPAAFPGGVAPTNLPAGSIPGGASGNTSGRAAFTNQDVSLKDGLSATVTVPIQQKDNVIIVPNRAIKRQAGNTTVQVIKGTALETRAVKTGLSDGTNTEITEGLSEGEQVQITTTSSTTGGFGGPPGGGGMMIVR